MLRRQSSRIAAPVGQHFLRSAAVSVHPRHNQGSNIRQSSRIPALRANLRSNHQFRLDLTEGVKVPTRNFSQLTTSPEILSLVKIESQKADPGAVQSLSTLKTSNQKLSPMSSPLNLQLTITTYLLMYNSTDHIRSQLIGDLQKFPTLPLIDSFHRYLESWTDFKQRLSVLDSLLDKIVQESPEIIRNGSTLSLSPQFLASGPNWDADIRPYLQMLTTFDWIYEKEGAIDILEKIWIQLNALPDRSFMRSIKGNWIYTNELSEGFQDISEMSKMSMISSDQISALRSLFQEWIDLRALRRTNLYPVFSILMDFETYGVNAIPILKHLLAKRESLQDSMRFNERQLTNSIKSFNRAMQYEQQIIELITTLKEMKEPIYPGLLQEKFMVQLGTVQFDIFDDELSLACMKGMQKAIADTPGAVDWFIRDGSTCSDNPILRQLSAHPAVEANGHSGWSMSWTLAQYQEIYQNGWNSWLLKQMLSRGIGWDTVDFDLAFEYDNEECCVYHVKKMVLSPSQGARGSLSPSQEALGYSPSQGARGSLSPSQGARGSLSPSLEVRVSNAHAQWKLGTPLRVQGPDWTAKISKRKVIQKVIDRDWEELGAVMLDQFGSTFSRRDYKNWSYECDDRHRNGVRSLFMNAWQRHYPRTVTFKSTDFHKIARELWVQLAARENIDTFMPPTDEEIDASIEPYGISELKGVHMHFFGEDRTQFDPYTIDRKLGDAFFNGLVADVTLEGLPL